MENRLDAIKGAAILLIVANHLRKFLPYSMVYAQLVLPQSTPSVSDLIAPLLDLKYLVFVVPGMISGLGYQGAHLFLIASGFGLTLSFLRKGIQLRRWYLRRAERILPMYWLSLVILLVLFLYYSDEPRTRILTAFVLQVLCVHILVPAFFHGFLINAPHWFIGLLFQFYLFFPLLVKLFKRWKPLQIFLLSVLITAIVRLIGLYYLNQFHMRFSVGAVFLCRLAEFVFGMTFAYHIASRPQNWIIFLSRFAIPFYFFGILLHCSKPTSALSDTVIGISLFLFLWSLASYVPSLVLRGIVFLGRHALGIFIFHSFFIRPAYLLVSQIGIRNNYLMFFCMLLICVAVGTIVDMLVARVQGAIFEHLAKSTAPPQKP